MPSKQFSWWLCTSWIDTEDGEEPRFVHPVELMVDHGNVIDYMKGQQECCPETLRMHWQWICHVKKKMTAEGFVAIVGPWPSG